MRLCKSDLWLHFKRGEVLEWSSRHWNESSNLYSAQMYDRYRGKVCWEGATENGKAVAGESGVVREHEAKDKDLQVALGCSLNCCLRSYRRPVLGLACLG